MRVSTRPAVPEIVRFLRNHCIYTMESQYGETNSLEVDETENSLKSSLVSSTVSESIVDANKAGILGFSQGNSTHCPYINYSNLQDAKIVHVVDENHSSFVLMYDMLTGIRHSVSVCQAKPLRILEDSDFHYART